jgi:hypothetical protein
MECDNNWDARLEKSGEQAWDTSGSAENDSEAADHAQ